MATVKSSGQVTILDITDGYSVGQTVNSWTIPATNANNSTVAQNGSAITTTAYAFRGSEDVSDKITITKNAIKFYQTNGTTALSGQTAAVATNKKDVTLTVNSTSLNTSGLARIPVVVTHSDGTQLTFNCDLVFSIARTGGQGTQGLPGEDAILISITANPSTIIRNNKNDVTLTAHVYKAGAELNSSAIAALGTLKWYLNNDTTAIDTDNPSGHTLANSNTQLTVTAAAVSSVAAYTVQLEG